jgi:predicted dehydrogenase
MTYNITDPYAALLSGPTRVAVLRGDWLTRAAEWRDAFDALPGVVAHLCEDLAEHEGRDDVDLVVVSGGTDATAAIVRYALERGLHVVYDQPISTSVQETRDLYALAERQNRHLAHVTPYGRPADRLLELLVAAQLGSLRWAGVSVRLADPAIAAAPTDASHEELAMDALLLVLPLLGSGVPIAVAVPRRSEVAAVFAADLHYGRGATLTVSLERGDGVHDVIELGVEVGSCAATVSWTPGSGAALEAQLVADGERTPLLLGDPSEASACFTDTAVAILAAVRSDEPFDDEAGEAALRLVRIAGGLAALATATGVALLRD